MIDFLPWFISQDISGKVLKVIGEQSLDTDSLRFMQSSEEGFYNSVSSATDLYS